MLREDAQTYPWVKGAWLRLYTLQTKPALHQARKLMQFPKASWGTPEMKRRSPPSIMDALYDIYMCSLISQGVNGNLPRFRQCANAPGTWRKASRPKWEGMSIKSNTELKKEKQMWLQLYNKGAQNRVPLQSIKTGQIIIIECGAGIPNVVSEVTLAR